MKAQPGGESHADAIGGIPLDGSADFSLSSKGYIRRRFYLVCSLSRVHPLTTFAKPELHVLSNQEIIYSAIRSLTDQSFYHTYPSSIMEISKTNTDIEKGQPSDSKKNLPGTLAMNVSLAPFPGFLCQLFPVEIDLVYC